MRTGAVYSFTKKNHGDRFLILLDLWGLLIIFS